MWLSLCVKHCCGTTNNRNRICLFVGCKFPRWFFQDEGEISTEFSNYTITFRIHAVEFAIQTSHVGEVEKVVLWKAKSNESIFTFFHILFEWTYVCCTHPTEMAMEHADFERMNSKWSKVSHQIISSGLMCFHFILFTILLKIAINLIVSAQRTVHFVICWWRKKPLFGKRLSCDDQTSTHWRRYKLNRWWIFINKTLFAVQLLLIKTCINSRMKHQFKAINRWMLFCRSLSFACRYSFITVEIVLPPYMVSLSVTFMIRKILKLTWASHEFGANIHSQVACVGSLTTVMNANHRMFVASLAN